MAFASFAYLCIRRTLWITVAAQVCLVRSRTTTFGAFAHPHAIASRSKIAVDLPPVKPPARAVARPSPPAVGAIASGFTFSVVHMLCFPLFAGAAWDAVLNRLQGGSRKIFAPTTRASSSSSCPPGCEMLLHIRLGQRLVVPTDILLYQLPAIVKVNFLPPFTPHDFSSDATGR